MYLTQRSRRIDILIAEQVSVDSEDLTGFVDELLAQLKSGVVAIGSTMGEKCQLIIAVSPDLVQKNVFAQP